MDFGDSPAEAEFRLRLREWLRANNPGLPASSTDDDYWAGQAAWHQSLYDGGFFGLSWPKEIGGHGLPTVYEVIVDEETPGFDILEVTELLVAASQPTRRRPAVVVVSAELDVARRVALFRAGVVEVVSRPLSLAPLHGLLTRIDRALSG